MSRNYANIVTSIWRDAEFCNLSAGAQRTYFMLISQPEISAAGVLPLTVNRWSKTLPVAEREHLAGWLEELAEHSYICLDWGTEELLVRSFIRWDRGYNNPKRQPVIREAISLVTSPVLQGVLRDESDKLGFAYGESSSQVDRVSRSLSRNPGMAIPKNDDLHRVVVKDVVRVSVGSTSVRPPQIRGARLRDDWKPTDVDLAWASEKCPGVNHLRETEKFRNYWQAKPGKDAAKIDWSKTWRNWLLSAAERLPGGGQPKPVSRDASGRKRIGDW